jgi:type IV secretion system protein TrbI
MSSTPDTPTPARAPIRERDQPPQGILPRHVQTWLMVGLAVVIVLIILVTGRPTPPPTGASNVKAPDATLAPTDRIRSYAQQLADEEARQHAAATTAQSESVPSRPSGRGTTPATDEQQRREANSLFADNVALSRRPTNQQLAAPVASPVASKAGEAVSPEMDLLARTLSRLPTPTGTMGPAVAAVAPPATVPAAPAAAPVTRTDTPAPEYPADGLRHRLLEGTVIEAALVNRLDGTFAGPVISLVTTSVYTPDRQLVLIPAGARVLGSATPVQGWGDARLAVTFHRLVMPDGHTYSLNQFKGLDQVGETGLRDAVNRHYLQVFGASIAIGALSGLAQYGTRSTAGAYDFGTEYRQATGASLATSASRVLDRYLNVLPTITIREGTRVRVYLTNDLALPAYGPAGGLR